MGVGGHKMRVNERSPGGGDLTAAIDLGGTNARVALVDADGAIHHRATVPTPTTDPEPDVLPRLVIQLVEATAQAVERVVVGLPGIIDHERDALVEAPNLPPSWRPCLTGDWLSTRMGVPVALANDADLAAVGESSFGAGRHHRDVVYVTVSTGVGAGVVVDGLLVRGRYSGGEIGHTVIDRGAAGQGQPCTVEELGAGPAIAAGAARAGLTERDAALADLVRAGRPEAVEVWTGAIEAVGYGVVNMAWLVTPQIVVVGGGVGRNHDLVAPIVSRLLADHGPRLDQPIEVAAAALGDDAGLAGAAAWFQAIGRLERARE